MGRIVVHLHGATKQNELHRLIEMYSKRVNNRGIRIEVHSNKLSSSAYLEALFQLQGDLYLMDEGGVIEDSVSFAKRLKSWTVQTHSTHLAIGPAEGWIDVQSRDCKRLSLSPMTMPHELASVVLVEQLYRATEILRGSEYHKA